MYKELKDITVEGRYQYDFYNRSLLLNSQVQKLKEAVMVEGQYEKMIELTNLIPLYYRNMILSDSIFDFKLFYIRANNCCLLLLCKLNMNIKMSKENFDIKKNVNDMLYSIMEEATSYSIRMAEDFKIK